MVFSGSGRGLQKFSRARKRARPYEPPLHEILDPPLLPLPQFLLRVLWKQTDISKRIPQVNEPHLHNICFIEHHTHLHIYIELIVF